MKYNYSLVMTLGFTSGVLTSYGNNYAPISGRINNEINLFGHLTKNCTNIIKEELLAAGVTPTAGIVFGKENISIGAVSYAKMIGMQYGAKLDEKIIAGLGNMVEPTIQHTLITEDFLHLRNISDNFLPEDEALKKIIHLLASVYSSATGTGLFVLAYLLMTLVEFYAEMLPAGKLGKRILTHGGVFQFVSYDFVWTSN